MHIGVIPARAGSKRFPGKNRAILNGKSLWRISAQKSTETMDRTIVNSDDRMVEVQNALKANSVEFYQRPEDLCGDDVRIDEVLLEMVDTLDLDDNDFIHLFQPTSPFTRKITIQRGKELLESNDNADSVQSVFPIPNVLHAYSQRIRKQGGYVEFAYPAERSARFNSQRKPEHYSFAGYVAFRVGSLRKYGNIWGEVSIGIQAEAIETVDIDTREDLENAIRLTRTDVRGESCISSSIRGLGATV